MAASGFLTPRHFPVGGRLRSAERAQGCTGQCDSGRACGDTAPRARGAPLRHLIRVIRVRPCVALPRSSALALCLHWLANYPRAQVEALQRELEAFQARAEGERAEAAGSVDSLAEQARGLDEARHRALAERNTSRLHFAFHSMFISF